MTVTTGFYVGSTFVAFNNKRYYDIFSESVPLGQTFLEYGERHHWDTLTAKEAFESGKDAAINLQRFISSKLNGTSAASEAEKKDRTSTPRADAHQQSMDRLKSVRSALKTNIERTEGELAQRGKKAAAIARHQASELSDGVEDLIRKAEAALSGKPIDPILDIATASPQHEPSPPDVVPTSRSDSEEPTLPALPKSNTDDKSVYSSPLPVGFEPPPGYSLPKPPQKQTPAIPVEADAEPPTFPVVASAVSQFCASEPVIVQLASTIDDLASYLDSNPAVAAKAKNVLESAKTDLTELANRIEKVKEEEQARLERKSDEREREYMIKLLELEMEAQDKLDSQEEGFQKYFDEERVKFVQAYREKLDNELRTQTELINER